MSVEAFGALIVTLTSIDGTGDTTMSIGTVMMRDTPNTDCPAASPHSAEHPNTERLIYQALFRSC